jgi:hypothetical protein
MPLVSKAGCKEAVSVLKTNLQWMKSNREEISDELREVRGRMDDHDIRITNMEAAIRSLCDEEEGTP